MLLLDDHEGSDTDVANKSKKKENMILSEIAEEDDVSTISE